MINTSITVDVASPNLPVVAYAEQGDKLSRQLTVTMMEHGTAWTPPAGAVATVRYVKPDGTGGFYDHVEDDSAAVSVTGNVAVVKMAQQMITVAGDVFCQLSWYTTTERVSTFCWRLMVEAAPIGDGTIVSTDYWNILTTQIQAAIDAAERAEEAAESVAGMTADAETGAAGSSADVEVTGGPGTGDPYNLHFTIPRGNTGVPGPAPTVQSTTINYAISTSGTVIPTTGWSPSIPTPEQGKFVWTRTVISFGTSGSSTTYSVAYYGTDGSGAVSTVNNQHPVGGNVTVDALTTYMNASAQTPQSIAAKIQQMDDSAYAMSQAIATLNNTKQKKLTTATVTLTVAGWSANTQTVSISGLLATDNVIIAPAPASFADYTAAVIYCSAQAAGSLTFTCSNTPTAAITVNVMMAGV